MTKDNQRMLNNFKMERFHLSFLGNGKKLKFGFYKCLSFDLQSVYNRRATQVPNEFNSPFFLRPSPEIIFLVLIQFQKNKNSLRQSGRPFSFQSLSPKVYIFVSFYGDENVLICHNEVDGKKKL